MEKTGPYVKYPVNLSYLFDPVECRFILHMLDIEFIKSRGYDTSWSRAEYMRRMGLSEYSFDKCIEKFTAMALLQKRNNKLGNRVYYSFNIPLYTRLVEILSATTNIDKVIEFCDKQFKKAKRSIESITDDEINSLRSGSGLARKLDFNNSLATEDHPDTIIQPNDPDILKACAQVIAAAKQLEETITNTGEV